MHPFLHIRLVPFLGVYDTPFCVRAQTYDNDVHFLFLCGKWRDELSVPYCMAWHGMVVVLSRVG